MSIDSRRESRLGLDRRTMGDLMMTMSGDEGPGGSVARPSRRPLNSLLLPGGFNRAILG